MQKGFLKIRVALFLGVGLILAVPPLARAHADLLAMIDGVTQRISASPTNASLYLLRGELYRTHSDWKLAETDYNHVAQLQPTTPGLQLARGKLFFESGRNQEAKAALDEHLAGHPNDVDGLITRAQLSIKLEERATAISNFTRAISQSVTPLPDYFLERAKLQVEQGQLTEAITGLNEGLKRLGQIVALQIYAIDLECARRNFDEALKRVDFIASGTERKEKWLVRRGEILLQANRPEEARLAFEQASMAIESLPVRLRAAPTMVDLKTRINQASAEVSPRKL